MCSYHACSSSTSAHIMLAQLRSQSRSICIITTIEILSRIRLPAGMHMLHAYACMHVRTRRRRDVLQKYRHCTDARFTLADPMPRLGSDVVDRRQFGTKPSDVASAHHSHWPNCVGWYEGVVQYCTTPWLVR